MDKKFLSAAFAACMVNSSVIVPTVAVVSNAPHAVAAPTPGKVITKFKDVARTVCEWGACWAVVERVVEYFQAPATTSDAPNSDAPNCSMSGKGCTTRTGGSAVKVGETRTIIRKVRIR